MSLYKGCPGAINFRKVRPSSRINWRRRESGDIVMVNLIGQPLGQYRIIEQIGAGGMTTVYKAYQSSLDQYVAVEVLPHRPFSKAVR